MATSAFGYGLRVPVPPPAVVPSGRGLLFAADVRDVPDGAPELRGYYFDSDSAETTVGVVSYNGTIHDTGAMADNQDIPQYQSDDPFSVFGAFTGTMPIRSAEEANARAAARLKIGEGLGVEKAFWNGTLALHAAGNVLNGGTAVTAKLGVGLLMEWAGKNYAGVPLLHAGLRAVNELSSLQLVDLTGEGVPSVKGGAVLVPGAGYYDTPSISGTTPAANQVWVFASGRPLLYRGNITPTVAPAWSINQVRAFAQRTYTPGVDGLVAAVLVNLT